MHSEVAWSPLTTHPKGLQHFAQERSQDQVPKRQGEVDNSIGKAGSSNTNSQPSTQHNPLGGRVASAATTRCAPSPMCVPSHTFRGSAVWAAMCQFTHYYMQLHVNSETALTKESQYGEPHSPYWDFFISLQTYYCAFGGAICGAAVIQRDHIYGQNAIMGT